MELGPEAGAAEEPLSGPCSQGTAGGRGREPGAQRPCPDQLGDELCKGGNRPGRPRCLGLGRFGTTPSLLFLPLLLRGTGTGRARALGSRSLGRAGSEYPCRPWQRLAPQGGRVTSKRCESRSGRLLDVGLLGQEAGEGRARGGGDGEVGLAGKELRWDEMCACCRQTDCETVWDPPLGERRREERMCDESIKQTEEKGTGRKKKEMEGRGRTCRASNSTVVSRKPATSTSAFNADAVSSGCCPAAPPPPPPSVALAAANSSSYDPHLDPGSALAAPSTARAKRALSEAMSTSDSAAASASGVGLAAEAKGSEVAPASPPAADAAALRAERSSAAK